MLILRDVLSWKTSEVARLLGTTFASVTSTLQRARRAMKSIDIAPGDVYQPLDQTHEELLARYCDAFERDDVEALVSLLHEDATMSMPPYAWWLQGRLEIRRALSAPDRPCRGARLLPTAANGSAAFGLYRATSVGARYEPTGLVILETAGHQITDLTIYLAAERLFPVFGLPLYPTFVAEVQD